MQEKDKIHCKIGTLNDLYEQYMLGEFKEDEFNPLSYQFEVLKPHIITIADIAESISDNLRLHPELGNTARWVIESSQKFRRLQQKACNLHQGYIKQNSNKEIFNTDRFVISIEDKMGHHVTEEEAAKIGQELYGTLHTFLEKVNELKKFLNKLESESRNYALEPIKAGHILYFTLCAYGAKEDPETIECNEDNIRDFCTKFREKYSFGIPFCDSPIKNAIGNYQDVFAYARKTPEVYFMAGEDFNDFEAKYCPEASATLWGLLRELAKEIANQKHNM